MKTANMMISITKQKTESLTYASKSNARDARTSQIPQGRIMTRMQPWLFKLFVVIVTLQMPDATIAKRTRTMTAAETPNPPTLSTTTITATAPPPSPPSSSPSSPATTTMATRRGAITTKKMATITIMTTWNATAEAEAQAAAVSTFADIASEAYETIKPIEIITTNTTARTTTTTTAATKTKTIEQNTFIETNTDHIESTNIAGYQIQNWSHHQHHHEHQHQHHHQHGEKTIRAPKSSLSSSSNIGNIGNVTAGFMVTLANPLVNVQDVTQNLSSMKATTSLLSTDEENATYAMVPLNLTNNDIDIDIDDDMEDMAIDNLENLDQNISMSFHEYCLENRNSFADLLTIVLYTIVCIVGLFGNTLVIYVVLRFSKMQTVTNIYILNLAIADECFLIGIPFLLYTMRICSWTFGEYICKAYMVSTSITQFTSSIFLLIMSADRYIAVCHPISSPRYRTIRIAKLVSAIAWLTSAILMLPVILFASTISQEDGIHRSCNIEWPEKYNKHTGTTFILYTFFLGFAAPLCFILCFYYLVIKKLHAVGRKHKSKDKKRSHRKVTRLVLTVITVYVLCWLPQWISQVALINSSPDQSDLTRFEILIFLLLGCLAYSNSAMNPILYAFLSDNFRKSFSKAFTCMARNEVNAQLHIEPSIFTRHGGSRRRAGSKRLVAQTTPKTKARTALLPGAPGNNNSSTTTSSSATTGQGEKHTVAVAVAMGNSTPQTTITTTLTISTGGSMIGHSLNDTVKSLQTLRNGRNSAENVVLIFDRDKEEEEAICATVLDHRAMAPENTDGGCTLQTDL